MIGTLWVKFKGAESQARVLCGVYEVRSFDGILTVIRWPNITKHYELSEIESWKFTFGGEDE